MKKTTSYNYTVSVGEDLKKKKVLFTVALALLLFQITAVFLWLDMDFSVHISYSPVSIWEVQPC